MNWTSNQEYFPGIEKIKYEGPDSRNPLSFRWYDESLSVGGKPLKEHLKFACAYWHSFCGTGSDPFGDPTHLHPWNEFSDPEARAFAKADAAFEFMTKLGLGYYCFHDVDAIDFTNDIIENERRLKLITAYLKQKQEMSGIKLLWGTANLFSNRRYMNGAATNPEFHVLAHAGAQVKAALDATIDLGGENYVFWGGREGYMSLLNTNMKKEKEHLALFLHAAKDYARGKGFNGTFFIEPKPCEPSKHQYDYDAETVAGFLYKNNLHNDFKLNIEVNHATLAGHSFQHELQVAADNDLLGSIDANRGDYQNGWDTDQFPTNVYELTEAMLVILEAGGLAGGGINFDAKIRRNSTDPEDLFHAHIGAMDAFAKAFIVAHQVLDNSEYNEIRKKRYESFDDGKGKEFIEGKLSLDDLRSYALDKGEPALKSGRQEYLENLINHYL
jgi:xylose isomerase